MKWVPFEWGLGLRSLELQLIVPGRVLSLPASELVRPNLFSLEPKSCHQEIVHRRVLDGKD